MPCDQFSAKRRNKRQLPIDVPSSVPTKSLVGSSPIDVAPRMIIRPLRLRAGKFVFSDAKRLLQHYLPTAVRETEALWRALISLLPEPADAPERQSFEL